MISRRRQARRAALALGVLLGTLLEGAAWIGDARSGFRYRLLEALRTAEVASSPRGPEAELPWPQRALYVRLPDEGPAPGEPYRIGGRAIAGTRPPQQGFVLPEDLGPKTRRRLFLLGESAALGVPYPEADSAARQLAERLGAGYQVINAAQAAWTSGKLVPVAERIAAQYQPDVLVLYVGNNEWIHWTPAHLAWSQARVRLAQWLAHSRAAAAVEYLTLRWALRRQDEARRGDEDFAVHQEIAGVDYALAHPAERYGPFDAAAWEASRRLFLDTFSTNLGRMIRAGRGAGARVIVLTVPFNYRLSPAWKHPQPEAFVAARADATRRAIREARALLAQGRAAAALAATEAALAGDPHPPVLHYLRAMSLEALGRPLEAEAAYARSRDAMIGNLGSRLQINERIAAAARAGGAELVDVRRLFDDYEHARGRCCNDDLIHDDCHPTPLGQRLIAEALAKRLRP